jgi:hypothetical protein
MNTQKVTRIDLETAGERVLVAQWYEGWVPTSPCDLYDQQAGPITSLLQQYERQGHTVWMCDERTGRALCGEITRIDFIKLGGNTWQVRKYPYGWTARTHPIGVDEKPADFDLEAALVWCEQHHWQIRRWPDGARAWKGELLPVRDASAIRAMRRQVDKNILAGHIDARNKFDLAFDF